MSTSLEIDTLQLWLYQEYNDGKQVGQGNCDWQHRIQKITFSLVSELTHLSDSIEEKLFHEATMNTIYRQQLTDSGILCVQEAK